MAQGSNIEWTDATWNTVTGCKAVSPGCANCYSARLTATRLKQQPKYQGLAVINGAGRGVFTGEVRLHPDELEAPLHWRTPRRIFVNSMSDTFHEDVPFEFIDRVFAVMNATSHTLPINPESRPWHTYQILTKRPERMAEYMLSRAQKYRLGKHPIFLAGRGDGGALRGLKLGRRMRGEVLNAGACLMWPPFNVWLGTSCEDQPRADERIPHLLRCPAAVRFLSCEPLLGAVDLSAWLPGRRAQQNYLSNVHWVIVGGESGPGARPCDVAWLRSIVAQCRAVGGAGVPCFVKQLGSKPITNEVGYDGRLRGNAEDLPHTHFRVWLDDRKGGDPAEWPEDLRVREMPGTHAFEESKA